MLLGHVGGKRRNFSDLQSEYAKFVVLRMRFRMMAVIIHTAGSLHTYTRAPFICMKQCVQGRVHNVFIYVGSPNVHTKDLKYFFSSFGAAPSLESPTLTIKLNTFCAFLTLCAPKSSHISGLSSPIEILPPILT